jgi:HPt (histidine-containing phosphotransfer) domain-containing protein
MEGKDMQQRAAACTGETTQPLIDHAAMEEMWNDAGPDLFRDIAELFDTERRRRMAQLPDALAAGDRASLAFDAHSLKGAAAYVAAARLQDAARMLEHDALSAPPERLARLVAEVLSAADATGPALAAAIEELRA